MKKDKHEKLLTREEVCDMLRISKSSLRRYELSGAIKAVRLGYNNIRYLHDDVVDYIMARRS